MDTSSIVQRLCKGCSRNRQSDRWRCYTAWAYRHGLTVESKICLMNASKYWRRVHAVVTLNDSQPKFSAMMTHVSSVAIIRKNTMHGWHSRLHRWHWLTSKKRITKWEQVTSWSVKIVATGLQISGTNWFDTVNADSSTTLSHRHG